MSVKEEFWKKIEKIDGQVVKEKKAYIVVHTHRYGISTYPVFADHFPTEEEVVMACKIDYEPNKDEWLDIADAEPVIEI